MSTILKALRRLEQEKTRKDRPLREQVTGANGAYRGESAPPRRWPILLGGIGAGVFAGLAVLLLVFSRGDSADEVAPAAAAPAPPAATAAQAPAPQIAARARRRHDAAQLPAAPGPSVPEPAARPLAPEPEVPEDVAVIDHGTRGPRPIAEMSPASEQNAPPMPGSVRPYHRADPQGLPGRHLLPESDPVAEPPVDAGEAVAAVQPPAPAVAPAATRAPAPVPAPAVPPAREAPPAPAEAVATPRPAPRAAEPARAAAPRSEPAPAPRAASPRPAAAPFPALRVERTTWHPLAERRVALVEVPGTGEQSVHEGDLVAGAVVKRIEPSGVVFEHAGREVRRKIGEGG